MDRSDSLIGPALAHAREPVLLLNARGTPVWWNGSVEKLLGCDPMSPADRGRLQGDLLAPPAEAVAGRPCQARRPWSGGTLRGWAELLFVALSDQAGDPLGWLVHLRRPDRAPSEAHAESPSASIDQSLESALAERLARLGEEQRRSWGFEALPARGPAMRRVMSQLRVAIGCDETVLLVGEAATGKEGLAKVLHYQSERADRPLVSVDCRTQPPMLLRQQLVGDEAPGTPGILASPVFGTLLIAGAGGLTADLQDALLEHRQRAGEGWRLALTERIEPRRLLDEGRWSEPFFHEATRLVIELPALRERAEELPDHCDWLLAAQAEERAARAFGLEPAALDLLRRHRWPGNLAELATVLAHAARRAGERPIRPGDLPGRFREPEPEEDRPNDPPDELDAGLDRILETVERRLLSLAIERFAGNKSRAAAFLKISRARCHRRLEQLGL